MFRRSTFALNTEFEDSDSQETQCDELRQLVDAQLQAELKGKDEGQFARCELDRLESFSCSWRPDSELDDHRVRAHEAKVSVAQQQQEVVRATHSEAI